MMSSNRSDYKSASEWLSALLHDEAWLTQQERLQSATTAETIVHREDAIRRIGIGETYEFWEIYDHQVEKAVSEVWEIAELSLPKLKIQTIGMLSMAWLEQHSNSEVKSEVKKTSAKKKPEKPQKPRETMTFYRKSGVTEGHLILLYQKLVKEEWIEGNEADFKALFSNKRDESCVLTWKGKFGKGTLVEIFKQFVGAGMITVANGFTIPSILEGHFVDSNGKWLTGLDKGNAANDKALPIIKECVKLLKADPEQLIYGDYEEDEDFLSKYDPYDHQDLNIHKR
ncbi:MULTISPECIES: hypothetical protein [unclassified Prevotella]|uniref:hypothetical protein n=1 Tax=unclassified Prevotella TaxID=2638335 RepID=UPI00048EF817|nr:MULTISPECIES: hypothetical protein [unclassified Prevotella]